MIIMLHDLFLTKSNGFHVRDVLTHNQPAGPGGPLASGETFLHTRALKSIDI